MAKNWQQLLFASFVIIILFTIADYYAHQYLENKYNLDVVGGQYYFNKVLYGTPVLFIALLLIDQIITLSYYNRIYAISAVLHYVLLTPLIYFAEKRGYI